MARKKVRIYPSIECVTEKINDYFYRNEYSVTKYMLEKTGYDSIDDLWNAMYGKYLFGFDCGWVHVEPQNPEWKHEWVLDSNKYTGWVSDFDIKWPFDTQSTTLKKIQIQKALFDLGLDEYMYVITRLD